MKRPESCEASLDKFLKINNYEFTQYNAILSILCLKFIVSIVRFFYNNNTVKSIKNISKN